MGRAGPPPLTKKELDQRGSWLAKERGDAAPSPDAKAPPCPEWLSKGAKAAWRVIVPKLADMGYVAEVDQSALAIGCQWLADYRDACRSLELDGYSPMQTRRKESAATHLWKFFREFGMTSSARASMGIEIQRVRKEKDKRAKYTEGVVGKIGEKKQA